MKSAPYGERAEYLGYVAHESRNPLSTALWCAELLGRLAAEDRAGPRGIKLAAMAQRSLVRLARLLEDHFLLERLAAGGIPGKGEQLDLRALVEKAGQDASPGAGFVAEVGPWTLVADRNLLARTLGAMVAAAGSGGAQVRAEAPAVWPLRLTVRGAPVEEGALALPAKGAPSDPTGRRLGLAVAAAAARALGAALSVEEGALVLAWPEGVGALP